MKKALFTLAILIGILFFTNAQNITTTPEFPTANEAITIIFDATNTPLENYSGRLFTHTGAGITGSGNWQNVIGDWGNNSNQPELTNLGNKKWELQITPSIYDFYGIDPVEEVINLSFVFRSEDAATQTADLFIPVFNDELQVIYYFGEVNSVILEGDTYRLHAASPQADSIMLYINEELVYSTNDSELLFESEVTDEYGYWNTVPVSLIAYNSIDTIADTGTLTVFPMPTVEERPAGIDDGINYIDGNTAVLSLYAPEKEHVFVIGDFNDWEKTEDHYMKKTPDGKRYWVQIDNLTDGQEYIFQYLVDYYTYIGDPYAEKVSDPWNDQYISEETYPNMLDYPEGKAQGIATVLQTNQVEYEWQVENFVPPAVDEMVVYELLIRDFTEEHSFQSLIDTIGYFKRLGINVIELMPVNEFEGNISWGYNPNYYFAVDKYYGPKNKLKEFIDVCHANDIAVVIDMVLNHSFGTSPLVMLYWDFANNRPAENNPWYNPIPKHDFNVGFDFNHESPQTRAFSKRVNNFWLNEFKIDGFRFDLSKGFTQVNTLGNTNAWGQYDASRIDIWNDYASAIWETNPNAWIILEHFAENTEEKELSNNGMMLWGNLNHDYNEGTMGYNENGKSDFSWISYQKRGWQNPHVVGYMESHDEERLQFKNNSFGNSSGYYDIQDPTRGLKRLELAASFFFTIPGPKMIWQFGEMGYDYSIDYNGRTGPKPIRWDYLSDWRREYLFNVYAALIQLKTEYEVFNTTDFSLDLNGAQKSIILRHSDMDIVVVGNFGVTSGEVSPDWPSTGTWHEFFTQTELDVASSDQNVSLLPGQYAIYSSEYIMKPEWLNTSIDELPFEKDQSSFTVSPNPGNDLFYFDFELSKTSKVSIEIYDVSGQKVAQIDRTDLNIGAHRLDWNAKGTLLSGMYLAVLKIDSKTETTKFIVE
jgi:glycosidase